MKPLVYIFFMVMLVPVLSRASDGNQTHKGPNAEVHKYIKEQVMPVLIQKRQQFDAELNSSEKAEITQCRASLQQLRNQKLPDGKPALPDEILQQVGQAKLDLPTLEGWEAKTKQGQAAIKQRLEQYKAEVAGKREEETEKHNRKMEDLGERREINAERKAASGGFTDEEKSLLAELAVRSVNLPAGLRSQAQIKATVDGLIARNPDRNMSDIAEDIKSGRLKLTAETQGARVAGGQIGKVSLAANELDTFGDQTAEASSKVPRGDFVPWSRLRQMKDASISNPALLRFKTKMQALENAYNQLAARSGTDVDKRAHIHELFNVANSQEAVEVLIRSLKEEAVGAREAANRTIAETSGAAIPGTTGSPATPGAPGAAPPPSPAPAGARPGASGGAPDRSLVPGQTYQHKSGATVQIIQQ